MLLCSLFFFFFKQKTAYEMRISDWSSDVCSSDLRVIAKIEWHPGTPFPLQGFYVTKTEQIEELRKYCRHVFVDTQRQQMPVEEIGRASCRERVCQYV